MEGIIVGLVVAGIAALALLTPKIDAAIDCWIARGQESPRPVMLIPEGKYTAPLWRVWCAICRTAFSFHGFKPPNPARCRACE